jgi:light-regulated signal transduction histidine kinase (bacteriophytochrome)
MKFYRTTREALASPGSFWEAVYENPQTRKEISVRVMADCASGDSARMIWEDIPIERAGEKTIYISARNIPISGRQLMLSTVWDVTDEKITQDEIRSLNEALEQRVALRTRELRQSQLALLNVVDDLNDSTKIIAASNQSLEAVNKELAAFSYSVSHDLRAPLRSIDGFSSALVEDYGDKLNDEGKNYLERIRRATQNMAMLIDDMLNLSRVTQSAFRLEETDLSKIVREIADANQQRNPLSGLVVQIQDDVKVFADHRLMHIVMTNLLDNAWKFAGRKANPQIEFGTVMKEGRRMIFVRDNGVGFDMKYADKLFGTFQRLHRADEFPGTGIGLATVLRVINRHGGQVWAEGEVGRGATFYFTLPE